MAAPRDVAVEGATEVGDVGVGEERRGAARHAEGEPQQVVLEPHDLVVLALPVIARGRALERRALADALIVTEAQGDEAVDHARVALVLEQHLQRHHYEVAYQDQEYQPILARLKVLFQ